MLDDGRRSSKYPFFWASTSRPTRIEAPRLATPHENVSIDAVSWRPVRRRSLPCILVKTHNATRIRPPVKVETLRTGLAKIVKRIQLATKVTNRLGHLLIQTISTQCECWTFVFHSRMLIDQQSWAMQTNLTSPYAAMCSACFLPSFSIAAIMSL